ALEPVLEEAQPVAAHEPRHFVAIEVDFQQAFGEVREISRRAEPVGPLRPRAIGGRPFAEIDTLLPAAAADPVEIGIDPLARLIGTEAKMLDADHLGGLRHHGAEFLDRRLAAADMQWIKAEAQHAARPRIGLDQVVALVANAGMKGFRVGVRDRDRPFRNLDRFEPGALAAMRDIDDHADPVHLADDLATEPRNPAVVLFVTRAADEALVIVRQLHDPDAQLVEHLDQPDIVLDRRRLLESEDDRRSARLLRVPDFRGAAAWTDDIAVILEEPVPG